MNINILSALADSPYNPVVSDLFPEADGTEINGKAAAIGGLWVVATGNNQMKVQAGMAQSLVGGSPYPVATQDTGAANRSVAITLGLNAETAAVIARYVDANNFLLGITIAGDLYIFEMIAGVFILRSGAVGTVVAGDRLRLTDDGSTVTVFVVGGVTTVSYATTLNASATQQGFGMFSETPGTNIAAVAIA